MRPGRFGFFRTAIANLPRRGSSTLDARAFAWHIDMTRRESGLSLFAARGRLAQLVRALARQARGHRFESRIAHWRGLPTQPDALASGCFVSQGLATQRLRKISRFSRRCAVRDGSGRFLWVLRRFLRPFVRTVFDVVDRLLIMLFGCLQVMLDRHRGRVANPITHHVHRILVCQLGFARTAQVLPQLRPRCQFCLPNDLLQLGSQIDR